MNSRRTFLKNTALATLSAPLIRQCSKTKYTPDSGIDWGEVKQLFLTNKEGLLNFNTASAGLMPSPILGAYQQNILELQSHAPYEVYESRKPSIKAALDRLAEGLDTTADQLALLRNTTEGINLLLWGMPFDPGDEVICADIDYPYLKQTLAHIALSKGIIIKKIKIDLHKDTDDIITRKYSQALTARTRLLTLSYMTYREGYIMPVQKITELAHDHNVEVLVDAAHAAGQWVHSISELDCDYYITSLHKWMHAPLGTGAVFIKSDLIAKINVPFSYPLTEKGSMQKLTHIGTHNFANEMTLGSVMDFADQIGQDRKQDRIIALRDYFIAGLYNLSPMEVYTPKPSLCGIVGFTIAGKSPTKLKDHLLQKHKIHIKKTYTASKVNIIRASFNIHLDETDIDRLLNALEDFV